MYRCKLPNCNDANKTLYKQRSCKNTRCLPKFFRDIGSGLNFKRKGLKTILERAMSGAHITLVVAHRDRLARFGIDLIRQVLEQNNGKLVVLDKTFLSPEQELANDLLNIVHVFSARMHGLRSYKKQINQIISDNGTETSV